jgi:hypothetical protein
MNEECWAGLVNNQRQIADGRLTCSSIFDQPSSFLSERGGRRRGGEGEKTVDGEVVVVQNCFSVEEESIHGIVIEFPCLGSALACTTSTGKVLDSWRFGVKVSQRG